MGSRRQGGVGKEEEKGQRKEGYAVQHLSKQLSLSTAFCVRKPDLQVN